MKRSEMTEAPSKRETLAIEQLHLELRPQIIVHLEISQQAGHRGVACVQLADDAGTLGARRQQVAVRSARSWSGIFLISHPPGRYPLRATK